MSRRVAALFLTSLVAAGCSTPPVPDADKIKWDSICFHSGVKN